jgi:hypothetical protein
MPSSYTSDLPNDILLDTGVLYYDPVTPGTMVKFGGTRGGLQFNRGRTIRTVEVDGVSSPVVGIQRFIEGDATITGTAIVFSSAKLAVLEPGSEVDDSGTDPNVIRTITPMAMRTMIPSTAYHEWHVIWKRGNGGTFKVVFPVGLASFDSISAADNNEGEIAITITAANTASDAASTDETPATYYYEMTGPDIVEP